MTLTPTLGLVLSLGVVACSRGAEIGAPKIPLSSTAAEGDEVVATVDGRPILASAIATQARASGTTARAALDALIGAEALATEASARGLDTMPEAFEAGRTAMVYRFLELEFAPRARKEDIPARDLERAWERNRPVLDHEDYVDVWHILAQARTGEPASKHALAAGLAEEIRRRAAGIHGVDEFKAIAAAVTVPAELGRLIVEEVVTARKGWTVKEFSYAAFDQLKQVGDVSQVVKTEYGYHVMYLAKLIPAQHVSFAEAEPRLREGLWSEFQRRSFGPFVEELMRRHAIERHPDRIEAASPSRTGQGPAPDPGKR